MPPEADGRPPYTAAAFRAFHSEGAFGSFGPPKNIPGPVPRSSQYSGRFKYHIGILSVNVQNGLRYGRTVCSPALTL
ncbi:hypothetical protein JCGZ_22933 [Jatropha curcas]|uniref:Uncharacterized protein n=1 Tax=Jatropha curcas TaxID=180498 RepID=A0A067K2G1_JATCU|nr:hypothetical protein JCGZ_22933 [Jatropha curcas]